MRFAIHNIMETTTVVGGVPIEDGRPDQGFLTFTFPPGYIYEESADGLLIRAKSLKTLVPCQMKLMGGSIDHDKMMALWIADQEAGGGAGVGPFFHKDNCGTTLIASPRCWIDQAPPYATGVGRGELTWELRMQIPPAGFFIGGNSTV